MAVGQCGKKWIVVPFRREVGISLLFRRLLFYPPTNEIFQPSVCKYIERACMSAVLSCFVHLEQVDNLDSSRSKELAQEVVLGNHKRSGISIVEDVLASILQE